MQASRLRSLFLRLKTVILIICLYAAPSLSAPVFQNSAGHMMQRAFYLEEIQGDLEAAIKIYMEIIGRFSEGEKIKAQA